MNRVNRTRGSQFSRIPAMRLNKFAHTLEIKVDVITRIMLWPTIVILFLMMLLGTSDVFGRYLFNSPILGTADVIGVMMLCVFFLGVSYTAITRGHVSATVVLARLPRRSQVILSCITSFASAVIVALICWQLGVGGWDALSTGKGTPTIYLPLFYFLFAAAMGCFIFCLALVVQFLQSLMEAIAKE